MSPVPPLEIRNVSAETLSISAGSNERELPSRVVAILMLRLVVEGVSVTMPALARVNPPSTIESAVSAVFPPTAETTAPDAVVNVPPDVRLTDPELDVALLLKVRFPEPEIIRLPAAWIGPVGATVAPPLMVRAPAEFKVPEPV